MAKKKTFKVHVRYIFEGDFEIVADSKAEAEEYADLHCGMTIGNVHSTLDDEDVDWEFPVHPEFEILHSYKVGK